MDKKKKSFLNALTALLQMFITSLVGLVFNRTILSTFGSDYNGINSAISQIISTLMILEGGFSLASNVALFEPFGNSEYEVVNGILSATKKRFLRVGLIAVAVGLIITAIYPFIVDSSMDRQMIAALMLTALIPACYNLLFNMKYRVIILTDQREYIISIMTTLSYLLGNGLAIILMKAGFSLLVARVSIMAFLLINYWFIAFYCRKRYPFLDFNTTPLFDRIKGTGSVIILKVTSIIYSTVPIIAISTITENGTLLASVYAVYRSILAVVRDSLTSLTNAPRLAFGALFSEGREDETKKLFNQYELLCCMGIAIVIGSTSFLLMPFIDLYTRGVNDIQYKDYYLAIIMLSTVVLEILHIPSGQIIQMKGDFVVARRIQSVACILLAVSLFVGRIVWGLYGIVFAIFLAAILLAVLEIGYVSKHVFHRTIIGIIKNMLPAIFLCVIAAIIGMNKLIVINSYFMFILYGLITFFVLTGITLLIYYIVDKESTKSIIRMMKGTIKGLIFRYKMK